MLDVKVQFLYVIHQIGQKRQKDLNRSVCVPVGILTCLPRVAKMVCRGGGGGGGKHDAVFLLSVYTRLT